MKGVLSWLVGWASRAGTRYFCSAFAALVGPVQNIFFLTVHYSIPFSPIAQQAGQAAVLGRLSLSVSLFSDWCGKAGCENIWVQQYWVRLQVGDFIRQESRLKDNKFIEKT
jgi:hypothetical protein